MILVMPAKAGIHYKPGNPVQWIPAFAGMTKLFIRGIYSGDYFAQAGIH